MKVLDLKKVRDGDELWIEYYTGANHSDTRFLRIEKAHAALVQLGRVQQFGFVTDPLTGGLRTFPMHEYNVWRRWRAWDEKPTIEALRTTSWEEFEEKESTPQTYDYEQYYDDTEATDEFALILKIRMLDIPERRIIVEQMNEMLKARGMDEKYWDRILPSYKKMMRA